jgi:hypothetical protein
VTHQHPDRSEQSDQVEVVPGCSGAAFGIHVASSARPPRWLGHVTGWSPSRNQPHSRSPSAVERGRGVPASGVRRSAAGTRLRFWPRQRRER